MFTWFVVLALLGVWSSVAVVYFDIVDYDSVIGKLTAYDTDGDGDFDVEDAKVLLGLKQAERPAVGDSPEERTVLETSEHASQSTNQQAAEPQEAEPAEDSAPETPTEEAASVSGSHDVESEIQAAVPLPPLVEDDFVPDDPRGDSSHPYEHEDDTIDTSGALVEETPPQQSEGLTHFFENLREKKTP
ncbi:aspartyl/asparaginyl beta-hydroxylase-like [Scomber scombrus]|uniref:aspartyl/asparaginyl beta-hydroxylase-like n=1 Tax=Scomber scombrus TaxID=13677 RepID=UPI002DD8769A|nr:aspartyl/asparaginyl beta-hydroxylase-like [Scomber scombrus]